VPNIIFTGNFVTADPVQIMNAEVAAVFGRLSMSAEYQLARGTDIFEDFSGGVFSGPRGNATYQGVYAELGFFLTPEDYRRYDKKEGTWGRQIVARETSTTGTEDRGFFAHHMPVQLVCRYSYLDLASGNPILTPSSGAQAGWENDITAGLDWYINSQVHVLVNYAYTHLDYVNHTSGVIHGLGCRFHVDF
jgi:phosphate-selective porin